MTPILTGWFRHKRKLAKGFTLTELAIVLGIMGTILSAIWVASARVSANQKINRAVQQVFTIVYGIKGVYPNGRIPAAVNLTAAATNMGMIDSNLIATCSGRWGTAPSGTAGCAFDPFGTQIQIGSQLGWDSFVDSQQRFEIIYDTVQNSIPCPIFLATLVSQSADSGLVTISNGSGALINVTSTTTPTDVSSYVCTAAVLNLGLQFQL